MNRTQAMAKCNPQAIPYDAPKVDNGNQQKAASYDEALGFPSSCLGVSYLAHYSCLPNGSDTISRTGCAREVAKTLGLSDVDIIEGEIEYWVNKDLTLDDITIAWVDGERVFSKSGEYLKHVVGRANQIRTPVHHLLSEWEMEWQAKL